jgi:hypothetical protein
MYDAALVDKATMDNIVVYLDFGMAALEHFENVVCTPMHAFYASLPQLDDESMLVAAASIVRRSDRLSGTKRELLTLEIAASEFKRQRLVEEEELKQQAGTEDDQRRQALERTVQAYIAGLEPRLGQLIRDKAFSDIYDNEPLWRTSQWAERQLARVADREEAAGQWSEWLASLKEAANYSTRHALIKDDDGNPVALASLRPAALRRYHTQLTALRHVYTHLIVEQVPGTFYTHLTASCDWAAKCAFVCAKTVRTWMHIFEDGCGFLSLGE